MNHPQRKTRMALITLMSDIYVRGPRKLALYAQAHGFEVKLVFLPIDVTCTGLGPHCVSRIPESIVNDLLELTADCQVIGFSAMTDYMPMVRQLGPLYRARSPEKLLLLGACTRFRRLSSRSRRLISTAFARAKASFPYSLC